MIDKFVTFCLHRRIAVIVLAVLLNAVQYRRRVKPPSATDGSSTSQKQGGKARKADPALEKTAG